MNDTKNTLHIGLCMAGAISAGAYTAGVVDYLIEALDEWYKKKAEGHPDVPTHNVEISVIGGASAGGMTSIITAAALQSTIGRVGAANDITSQPKPDNVFYHSWVDLTQQDMFSELLKCTDITSDTVPSILNSNFIDEIADRAMSVNHIPQHRPYIANELKVFVSLTNLKGMEFGLDFESTSSKSQFIVTNHKDYACFKFCKNKRFKKNDGWIPVDLQTGDHLPLAKEAAMATGAFPIGLRARKITRDATYLNKNPWFDYITKTAGKPFSGDYESHYIDGGMINNEPFEKVRMVLDEQVHSNPLNTPIGDADANEFRSTVIMIDPFPSEDKSTIDFPGDDPGDSLDLPSVAVKTISALKNQSRVKPIDLKEALDPDNMRQFLIAPVRYAKDSNGKRHKSIEGKHAIACGSLGGFGGFLKKDFRIHDFYLGRANCEKFLRDYFIVPTNKDSKILDNGYSGVSPAELKQFTSFDADGNPRGRQIIPLFTSQAAKPDLPEFDNGSNWPSITQSEITRNRIHISKRVHAIVKSYFQSSSILKPIESLGILYLSSRVSKIVIKQMTGSIRKHKLMDN